MKQPWYETLFWAMVKEFTTLGLGPNAVSGAVVLPTGYSRQSDEDGKRQKIVDFMRSQLGKSYHLGVEVEWGQEGEAQEWDCSELTEAAYRLVSMPLPDGAQQQYDDTLEVREPLLGDLGFLWSDTRGKIGHVMVRSGPGAVIHAVGGRGVVEDLAARWETHPRWRGWRRHHDFIREVAA